jgi:hypothetical protein
MGGLDKDKPKLETGFGAVVKKILALPVIVYLLIVNGMTCIYITKDMAIRFVPTSKHTVEIDGETIEGVIVDGEFIPADGPGAFLGYSFLGTKMCIGYEDIKALLRPTAFDDEEIDVAKLEKARRNVVVPEGVDRDNLLRKVLRVPMLLYILLVYGHTVISVTPQGHVSLEPGESVDKPRPGIVVGSEFADNRGKGTTFKAFGFNLYFHLKGSEALFNPAVPEIMRAIDDVGAATDGGADGVGVGVDGQEISRYQGVEVRDTATVNVGRLAEYEPFAMKDGHETRQSMNFAFEALSKFKSTNTLLYVAGLIMAFFIGAISPRLNGSAGGGGGGGGLGIPMPAIMPPLQVDPALVADVVGVVGVIA